MSEYQYPLFDDKGRVVCQICGKGFQVISPRHLKHKHNIAYAEYKMRYPDVPLSSEEFIAKGKYGKVRSMFDENDNLIKKKEKVIVDEVFEVDDDIEIEEKTIKEFYERELKGITSDDPIQAAKDRIFHHLSNYLSNLKVDYMVQEYAPNGHLDFEAITDFCDPVLKIVIDFPNTFWHNQTDIFPGRDVNLESRGWKLIKIKSRSPSFKDIDEALERI
jgi:uncharacterized Zn finger protein (UPF0148 family)